MNIAQKLFRHLINNRTLNALFLRPFYFVRFFYYSIKENSTRFYRYYPGYHGSTIPSYKFILKNKERIFNNPLDNIDGIDLNTQEQVKLLEVFHTFYKEFSPSPKPSKEKLYFYDNPMLGFNDAFILYCFLRYFKPKNIIEIGSGFSSALMLDTVYEFNLNMKFIFIDPFSKNILHVLSSKPEGNYKHIREEVQHVDLEKYSALQENDILFIDTSHVVKIGGELSFIFFSILPKLQKGVIIHIHDIWHPWEYPESMINKGRIYNEIYFVRAFLQYNKDFKIMLFNSYIEEKQKDFISEKMPSLSKNPGVSLWLRKVN